MPNTARIERTTRYLVALIASLALLSALATAAIATQQDLGYSFVLKGPIISLFDKAIPITARNLVVGVGLTLPLGLVFGVMAGLRPGSRLARMLETPAILLIPVTVYPVMLIFVLRGLKSVEFLTVTYVQLIIGMTPWVTRAIANGLLRARSAGRLRPLRMVTGILGCLLQEIGPLLAAVFIAELAWVSNGLFDQMRRAIMMGGDFPFLVWALAIVLLGALGTRLLGELLAPPPPDTETPPLRPSAVWLGLGILLSLCLPVTAFLSMERTAVVQSAIAHGREWAALALATRQSLAMALGALFVASIIGLLMGGIARYAGTWGAAILSPSVSPSNWFRCLIGGLGALLLLGARPVALAIGIGIATAPAIACTVRRLMTSPHSNAWRVLIATACMILGEALMAEMGLRFLLGINMEGISGLSRFNILLNLEVIVRPQMAILPALPLAGIAGLFLVGHALTESDR